MTYFGRFDQLPDHASRWYSPRWTGIVTASFWIGQKFTWPSPTESGRKVLSPIETNGELAFRHQWSAAKNQSIGRPDLNFLWCLTTSIDTCWTHFQWPEVTVGWPLWPLVTLIMLAIMFSIDLSDKKSIFGYFSTFIYRFVTDSTDFLGSATYFGPSGWPKLVGHQIGHQIIQIHIKLDQLANFYFI